MDDALLVQKNKAFQHLVDVYSDEALRYFPKLFDQRIKRAIFDVLQHNIQMLLRLNTVQILYYLVMLKVLQKAYLVLDRALQVLLYIIEGDLLYRNKLTILPIESLVHYAAGAATDYFADLLHGREEGQSKELYAQR